MFDQKRFASTEFYQYRFRNFATIVIVPAACVIALIFGFMFFAEREVAVKTVGALVPTVTPDSVQSTANAQIVSNRLLEGKYVCKGATLLVYHNVQTRSEHKLLASQQQREQGKITALQTLHASVEAGQDQFRTDDAYGYRQEYKDYLSQRQAYQLEAQQIQAQQTADNHKVDEIQKQLQKQVNETQANLADYQSLYTSISKGSAYAANGTHLGMHNSYHAAINGVSQSDKQKVTSEYEQQIQTQLESLQANLDSLKLQQVQATQSDTSSIQAHEMATKQQSLQANTLREITAQIESTKQELDSVTEKISELKDDARDYRIKAPVSGILHVNNGLTGKQRIAGGSELAQIMPKITAQHNAKIELYVSPTTITSIHRGQKVRFRLARDVPSPVIMDARVINVDVGPTVVKAGNVFKVTAKVPLTSTQERLLHYGMQGQASIITGRKTYWHYVIDRLLSHES